MLQCWNSCHVDLSAGASCTADLAAVFGQPSTSPLNVFLELGSFRGLKETSPDTVYRSSDYLQSQHNRNRYVRLCSINGYKYWCNSTDAMFRKYCIQIKGHAFSVTLLISPCLFLSLLRTDLRWGVRPSSRKHELGVPQCSTVRRERDAGWAGRRPEAAAASGAAGQLRPQAPAGSRLKQRVRRRTRRHGQTQSQDNVDLEQYQIW